MIHRRDRIRRPMLEGLEWRLAPSGGPGPSPGGHHDVVDVDPGRGRDAVDHDPADHDAVDNDPADNDVQDMDEHHRGRSPGGL